MTRYSTTPSDDDGKKLDGHVPLYLCFREENTHYVVQALLRVSGGAYAIAVIHFSSNSIISKLFISRNCR